jgi:transmembrane sensor
MFNAFINKDHLENMNFKAYKVSDFLENESFLSWCSGSDLQSRLFWEEWLKNNPDKTDEVEEARRIYNLMVFNHQEISDKKVELILKKIHSGIESQYLPLKRKTTIGKVRNLIENHFYKVAAFGLVLLCLTTVYFIAFIKNDQVSYSVGYGETRMVNLPDGSQLKLNSNSSASYGRKWDANEPREIWIDGEAFFSVQHKKNHQKFIVHSSGINVEVLGTQFNVNNRKGITKVILNSGKVKLSEAEEEKSMLMSPGELVEFNPERRTFKKQMVETEIATAWRNDKLIFSNTSLRSIAQTLEDNYGLKVTFDTKEIASKTFTGTIPVKDVEILITSIAESFNLNVKRNKNKIVFIEK